MTAIDAPLETVRTTCPYCGVGCGVLAAPDKSGGVAISGDPDHPANFGRLCSKGSALGETVSLEGRLLHPMIRSSNGNLESVAWSDALDTVASGLQHTISTHGKEAVAFYLSGQLLTEDYYVANKLMKGFIGTANVDTNSRLCMASSVAGHRRAFGSDTVPGNYEDLDQADLIVVTGSNTAWCHPVLFQRMLKNKHERGARIVVIDPRRTATAEDADLFLGIRPGTDTALFSGLLTYLADHGALDRHYIAQHTSGFDAALAQARAIGGSVAATALATGLTERDVAQFFHLFGTTVRVVTAYSQGVNQSAQGTDKVNAIINCHLATGRIGKVGAGPFSLTGQPNAMGGREVGGLANQLAAHMVFTADDTDRVGRFWNAPRIATREGLKAVQLFEAIGRGEVRALWVMGTNPAVSLPNANAVRAAMAGLDMLVVSENVLSNDTVNSGAHVVLPALAWGEKSGTVTNSERRVSRQRSFLPIPGEAKPDWWIVSEVAKRLGFADAFDYATAADIFREHARLSAFENDGKRSFDIGGLAGISNEDFDQMPPTTWPVRFEREPQARLFADGGFQTDDGKARFVAVEMPALKSRTSAAQPLRLSTGRVRDQWHTMTRTGKSIRLGQHIVEPYVELHPDDAAAASIGDDTYAELTTEYGSSVVKAVVTDRQQRGMAFAPIHWNDINASSARIGALSSPATDAFSGQPEMKATPLAIAPVIYAHRGFVLSREPVVMPPGTQWSCATVAGGYGYLLADSHDVAVWSDWFESNAGTKSVMSYRSESDTLREAVMTDDAIDLCLFIEPFDEAVTWDVVKELFAKGTLTSSERRLLLSGKSTAGLSEKGPIVCACFGVGRNTIQQAIQAGACSVSAIGETLKAGTNCGSCVPELKRLLANSLVEPPAVRETEPLTA